MDPKSYVVTVTLRGYPESVEELARRVRGCIETHPTLSFRVETVSARDATDTSGATGVDPTTRSAR